VTVWRTKAIQDAPTAWLEITYAKSAAAATSGHLKIGLLLRHDYPLLCVHDEPGYRFTFERIASAFFEHFRPNRALPQVRYFELQVAFAGELPAGFTALSLESDDKPGQLRWEVRSLLMLPTSTTQLDFQESIKVQVIDSRQRLISGAFFDATGEKIVTRVEFESAQGSLYRYRGEVQGKAVQGQFRAKTALPSDLATASVIAKRLEQPQASEFRHEEYFPSVNASAPIQVLYRIDARINPAASVNPTPATSPRVAPSASGMALPPKKVPGREDVLGRPCGCAPGDLPCALACAARHSFRPVDLSQWRRTGRVKFGSLENVVVFDAQGLFAATQFAIGARQIQQLREFSRGSLLDGVAGRAPGAGPGAPVPP
jgi:hypothetical protein